MKTVQKSPGKKEATPLNKKIAIGILILIALLGVGITGISLLPYPLIQSTLDHLAANKHAEFFNYPLYLRTRLFLATGGIVFILLSVLGAIRLEQTQDVISRLVGSIASFISSFGRQIAEYGRKDGWIYRTGLCIVFLIGIIIRGMLLFNPIRSDEAYTYVDFSSKAFIHLISDYSAPNNHILHSILVHIAVAIFGNQPWAIRLPAFLAGALLIPASYLVARMIYNKQAALLAATLIATCPALIEFSDYARGYSMICVISVLLIILGVFIIREQSPGSWFFFVVVSVLGFYTIPIMLYPFACVTVWISLSFLIRQQAKRLWEVGLSTLAVIILTGLLYAPVLFVSGFRALVSNEYVSSKSWSSFVAGFLPSIGSTLVQWSRGVPIPISGLVALGLVMALIFNRRLSHAHPSLFLPTVVCLVLLLMIQRVNPFSRVWLFLLPWVLIAASAGCLFPFQHFSGFDRKYSQFLIPAAEVLLCVGLAISARNSFNGYQPEDSYNDAKDVAAFLAPRLGKGDRVVLVVPEISPLEYYLILDRASTQYLYVNYADAERLIILVDEPKQTLDNIMNRNDIPEEPFNQPDLLKIIGSTDIYQMTRKN